MKGAEKRSRWVTLRVTGSEYSDLSKRFNATPYPKMSDYVRLLLFEKPVVVKYRNQSMDEFMELMIIMRVELNALGNNFNQVVRKLNSVQGTHKFDSWLQVAEYYQRELLNKVTEIQRKIDQFSEVWLQ